MQSVKQTNFFMSFLYNHKQHSSSIVTPVDTNRKVIFLILALSVKNQVANVQWKCSPFGIIALFFPVYE